MAQFGSFIWEGIVGMASKGTVHEGEWVKLRLDHKRPFFSEEFGMYSGSSGESLIF